MKTTTKALIFTIILTITAMPALAQRGMQGPPPDEGPREEGGFAPEDGPGGPPSEERREEIRKKIETIRMWRMTEELKLDPATSGKLAAQIGSFDQKRRELMREQRESMQALRQSLTAQKPDEAKLKQLLDTLEKNHRAMQELRTSESRSIREILTVEQQARYVIFQQEFRREMRGMIKGARGNGPGQGRGPGMGSRPGAPNRQ